jgi:hypothetical protein
MIFEVAGLASSRAFDAAATLTQVSTTNPYGEAVTTRFINELFIGVTVNSNAAGTLSISGGPGSNMNNIQTASVAYSETATGESINSTNPTTFAAQFNAASNSDSWATMTLAFADTPMPAYPDTGFVNPTASGSPNNGWTNPSYAYIEDGNNRARQIAGAYEDYSSFGLSIPAGATIIGIEARVRGGGAVSPASTTGIELSWNGGTTYTSTGYTYTLAPNTGWSGKGAINDTWGRTWAPGDFSNANFRARLYGGDSTGSIDVLQLRVTYQSSVAKTQTAITRIAVKPTKSQSAIAHLATNPTKTQAATAHTAGRLTKGQSAVAHIIQSSDVPKRYAYKVYSGSTFLGLLPNVLSEFDLAQDINTAGSQITIRVGVSADTAYLPTTTTIDDETGVTLTDETGDNLLTEGAVNIVGVGTAAQSLIKNGNRVVVYEYGKYHPNGIPLFNGEIEKWTASFGSLNGNGVEILAYSVGQDMDNRIISTGNVSVVGQLVAATTVSAADYGSAYAQPFTPTSDITIGAVSLRLKSRSTTSNAYVQVQIVQGNPANDMYSVQSGKNSYTFGTGNTVLATSSGSIISGTTAAVYPFTFPSNLTLTSGIQYYALFYVPVGSPLTVYADDTSTPLVAPWSKAYYGYLGSNNVSTGMYATSGPDQTLYIDLQTVGGNTLSPYTNTDPADMLKSVMDNYGGQGGMVTYTAASIQATGLSLTYTFNTQTTYEGLKAALSLAPDGFYYTVDLGTNLLTFKQASTTADIIVVKGRHIETIDVVASIENTVNTVYFSGGIPSGQTTNLYKLYKDAGSIGYYGQRLARVSDNRVTLAPTADAIGQSKVAEGKDEQYQTVVTVLDSMMDITLLKPGMVVGFRGFGTFVDGMLSQIVRVQYTPHEAKLTLGILPRRLVPEFEKITRGLIAEQTIANPTSPA